MSEIEVATPSSKRSRRFSQMTKDTKYTCSTHDQNSPSRRKVSFDYNHEKGRKMSKDDIAIIDSKCKFKLSTEVLSFEMEEQRTQQLKTIKSNTQLLSYYNCLKKLFMILYQSSIPLQQNKYNISYDTLRNNNLQILAVIFDNDSTEWNLDYVKSLQTFAENMTLLSSSSSQFERRIELVAIKSTLHNEKRPKIEKAFLNTKIEACWAKIQDKFADWEIFSYIQDQFEKAQEKLCFIQIQEFVKSKLSTSAFSALLKEHCRLEEIDHDMNFSFKFQFFMAEQLCFNSLQGIFKEDSQEANSMCQIM